MRLEDLFRATLDFIRVWITAAGEIEDKPFGLVVRNERYPLVHTANLAWVDRPSEGGPAEILAALDEAFHGTEVRHRHVLFVDPGVAYEAQEPFADLGFRPTAEVVLAKVGLPSCIVNPEVELREVGPEAPEPDYRRVREAIHEDLGYTREESLQVYEMDRHRSGVVGERAYVGYVQGRPVASATLWPRGVFGMIGDVGTVPEFRMRGVGRTMIFRVLERSLQERVEYAVLTANRSTWVPAMYETLGFTPVGEIRGFLRL